MAFWDDDEKPAADFEIATFDYMGSAIGNAYFSGLTFEQLWDCTHLSSNREEFDEAVTATIRLNELVNKSGQHTKNAASTSDSCGRGEPDEPVDAVRGPTIRSAAVSFWRYCCGQRKRS